MTFPPLERGQGGVALLFGEAEKEEKPDRDR